MISLMMGLDKLQENLKTSSTRFYIDPPTGWRYGFPVIIDFAKEQLTEEWLIDKGYPAEMVDFGMQHLRLWSAE